MKENIICEKAFKFAIRVVKYCRYLNVQKEYVISQQLLRSGTSIGANLEEAKYAQSRKDFVSKQSISLKEASESKYWLRLLKEITNGDNEDLTVLISECEEIIKLLTSSINTSKKAL